MKQGQMPSVEEMSVRRRSVFRLGRACQFDEAHALTTAQLALGLYDSARIAKLHRFGAWERELLDYAALLHHIGAFLTYSNYQAHTYYLIRNAELLGFDQTEVALIAAMALFHRKALPRKKHPEFADLNKQAQQIVRILSLFLRFAESLDRSQSGNITHASFEAMSRKRVILHVAATYDCHIEIWGVQKHLAEFGRVFGRTLEINVLDPEDATDSVAPVSS
jgi:exopolyphosphatase/guanosine-5'-triphosphate,3'-diphosphate pyrophosphatase